jgi:prolyl-tRNA synthetase
VEVILDDRDERPGVKFKDADLVGFPLRVSIGEKSLANGEVELKPRGGAVQLVKVEEALAQVRAFLAAKS